MIDFEYAPWLETAKNGDLASAIVEYVTHRRHVTFVEIQNEFGSVCTMDGNYCFELPELNIVTWAGMSKEFVDAIIEIKTHDRLYMNPTMWLVYMMDGGSLSYPIAKRIPKGGYKSLHWLPVCWDTEAAHG